MIQRIQGNEVTQMQLKKEKITVTELLPPKIGKEGKLCNHAGDVTPGQGWGSVMSVSIKTKYKTIIQVKMC